MTQPNHNLSAFLTTCSPLTGRVWRHELRERPNEILHYQDPPRPLFFYGGWLSSFAYYPFAAPMLFDDPENPRYPTHWWKTREHFYQAHKPTSEAAILAIAAADSPAEAKRLGNSRDFQLREHWDWVLGDPDSGYAYRVMLQAIKTQIGQHPDLAIALRCTEGQFIAEVSPIDAVWGIYHPSGTWDGLNLLGAAWMEARDG